MTAEFVTFGCRLNSVETDAMAAHAAAAGLENVAVVNTCAVTEEAVRQARQAIRRLGRERPAARIVATGCAVQTDPAGFAAMPELAAVLGNADKARGSTWEALSQRLSKPGHGFLEVGDVMRAQIAAAPVRPLRPLAVRAFVEVQNGCDHRCTFCIIPFGRGRSRSVPVDAVVAQARDLTARGAREIVLTGVDITSYGQDLAGGPRLGALAKAVLAGVPDLPRLRLSSIDGVEADPDLFDALATEPRLMPHLHLSLQSGDDLVLKRMKRRHTRADAIAFCRQVLRLRPEVVFGADLIAGFPTETEPMFGRSLDLVEECGLTYLHVFPYSPRPGTPAARMPQVPHRAVRERAARLRERGTVALAAHLRAHVGRTRRVLAETETLGRTEDYASVVFGQARRRGDLIEAVIAGHDGRRLLAP